MTADPLLDADTLAHIESVVSIADGGYAYVDTVHLAALLAAARNEARLRAEVEQVVSNLTAASRSPIGITQGDGIHTLRVLRAALAAPTEEEP